MRILYTADIHASRDHLTTLGKKVVAEKADTLIVGGDIIPHDLSDLKQADLLDAQAVYLETVLLPELKRMKNRRDVAVFLDMGNDDLAAGRALLERRQGALFQLLHLRRQRLVPGVDLVGYMAVPPTPFGRKDWEKPDTPQMPYPRGAPVRLDGYATVGGAIQPKTINPCDTDTIAADLAALSRGIKRPFVFVSHSPPWGTPLDLLASGLHVGSLSIRRFIERWSTRGRLLASLHGHIHEAPDVSGTNRVAINGVWCFNPGQNNGAGAALKYIMLELSRVSGVPRIHPI